MDVGTVTVSIDHEQWPAVAQPGVLERQLDDFDRGGQGGGS
jgi:hypothetical protein